VEERFFFHKGLLPLNDDPRSIGENGGVEAPPILLNQTELSLVPVTAARNQARAKVQCRSAVLGEMSRASAA
jgi:hypothetical protein